MKIFESLGDHRIPRKVSLLLVLLVIAIAIALILVIDRKPQSQSTQVGTPKYISLEGGYLFSIPLKYAVDETVVNGVAIVYPEASPPQSGQNLEQLYGNGTVAVQPITTLKDSNVKAFKDYVNGTLASDLRKSMHAAVDVRDAKQGSVPGFRVFALTNDGKRLRAIYAVDFSQPVIMVAKDENDTLKVVGSTIEDLKKSNLKPDIDQASQAAKTILEMAQKQDSSGIKKRATEEFNRSVTNEKLKSELKSTATNLSRPITIVGASYDGKDFTAQLIFNPQTKDGAILSGIASLHKDGKIWKLQAIQLPQ